MAVWANECANDPGPTGSNPSPARLVAFTWNLGRSPDALRLACDHLATQGSFVAALQEMPEDDSCLTLALGGAKLKRISRGVPKFDDQIRARMVSPSVELIVSDDIRVDPMGKRHEFDPARDDRRRLEGVPICSDRWRSLQVLGVHGWDRVSRGRDQDRADWKEIMRRVRETFWDGGPLIVMGDMNAHPWSEEITDPGGLYALRWKDWPARGRAKLPGCEKFVKPLYNPMWQILPDRTSGAHGTVFHEKGGGLRWHCFDQIIVSEHLREHVGTPAVLTSLAGHSLVDTKGKPRLSDHLPVQITVNIEKVTS